MLSACETGDVFALLEGGCGGAREAAECLVGAFAAVRDPWLVRSLLQYHARTGSVRALDLLARAPDLHARHLLDALLEQVRGDRTPRHHALAALAPLVARRPAWLHLLPAHALVRELLRAARGEREPAPLLHALLALAALVPAAPALAGAHAHELAEAVARAAGGAEAHAALAARALFRAVYATQPCAAVEALRASGAEAAGAAWERAAEALAGCVRLHPALVTGAGAGAAGAARWARAEPHDVLAECRRLSLPPRDTPPAEPPADQMPLVWRHSPAPPPGTAAQVARAASGLRPGGEGWFPLGERSGAESAPHTPLPADPDPAEPEPAVEATPENTPARPAFRFPAEGGAARALGRPSPPASGPGPGPAAGAGRADAYSARLARVAAERRANESPVPIGGAPPSAAARPEPRAPPSDEDREVTALTARSPPPPEWEAPPAPRAGAALDPRAAGAPPAPHRRPRAAPAPPARRPTSAPPAGARRADAASQTVDLWPEPYEFLLADCLRSPPGDDAEQPERAESTERLDAYLAELYAGRGGARAGAGGGAGAEAELAEQLALAHAQLMYERWRREAHAERNRRLLGRCRRLRALELHNAALQERVRALARERDRLRAPPAPPALPPPVSDREAALEEALERERAARLRAEAERREADARRERDAAELRRTRADAFEAARHVEALARAALAAERRAEHVRRLRRELLVLGEREARLAAAAGAGAAAEGARAAAEATERALRAAAARAEADAEAAAARAEAAAARAHELEAAVAARDAVVADLKRAVRAAADESAARARALHDKYAALLSVVRAADSRRLDLLAAPPAAPGGGGGGALTAAPTVILSD